MKAMKALFVIACCTLSTFAHSEIITDYFDVNGNPMHSGDEFNVSVNVVVQKNTQGYLYNYTVRSHSTSLQSIGHFAVIMRSDAIVPNSSSMPLYIKMKREPQASDVLSVMSWVMSSNPINPNLLVPGGQIRGLSFVSPYPPGIIQAYSKGLTEIPGDNALYPDGHPLYWQRTPYGAGKVFPVIGPVKPAAPNVTDNYSVVGCVVGICDVQLDITGPQDPYGTAYNYQWFGAFGTATGAKPLVQLAAGTYNVSVSVSDPYATLVTATMPITVVDSNPAATITPAQAAALTPAQLANLTPAQVASVIAALSPTQITMLTPLQISALTPAQVAVSLAALSPAQIAALSPAQLGGLTPAQIGVITPQLTPAQLAALSQLQGGGKDMDYDGIADDQDDDRDGDGKPNNEDLDPDHPD